MGELVAREQKAVEPKVRQVYKEMREALELARDMDILKLGERGQWANCITFSSDAFRKIEAMRDVDEFKGHLIRSLYDTHRDWKEGMLFRIHMEQIFGEQPGEYIKCAYDSRLCDLNKELKSAGKQDRERRHNLYDPYARREREVLQAGKEEYQRRMAQAKVEYFTENPRKRKWDGEVYEFREASDSIKQDILNRDAEYKRLREEWLAESPEVTRLRGEVHTITATDDYVNFRRRMFDALEDSVNAAMKDMQVANKEHCGKGLVDPVEIWKALGF